MKIQRNKENEYREWKMKTKKEMTYEGIWYYNTQRQNQMAHEKKINNESLKKRWNKKVNMNDIKQKWRNINENAIK